MVSEQVAWDFILSDLENFQGWKLYSLPGNLFHCWTILMGGKKVSPYTQSVPILSHHNFSHSVHTHHCEDPGSVFSVILIGAAGCCEVLPLPSHLQAEQAQLPWPFLTRQVLQHLTIMVALLNLLQFDNNFLVLGSQKWVAVSRCGLLSAK